MTAGGVVGLTAGAAVFPVVGPFAHALKVRTEIPAARNKKEREGFMEIRVAGLPGAGGCSMSLKGKFMVLVNLPVTLVN
jgi:hypothetical protein